jgi:peptide deformylase
MKKILQSQEGVLRKIAKEVPIKDIETPKIQKILKEMITALRSQYDGVALAAPQIGYSLQIFVVSGKIFSDDFTKSLEAPMPEGVGIPTSDEYQSVGKKVKDVVFINPVISKLSRKKEWMPEGCLSVRWLYGKTWRSEKAHITAYDENGKKFSRGASGLLAQIFQHETDHLKGILFSDHAKEIKEEKPIE